MTDEDVGGAARRHRRDLDHGLFPKLGTGFLRGYYRSLVAGPHAVALVAPADGRPAAHLVGTLDHHRHHRWALRRRGLLLAVRGALGLVLHPDALRLFLRTRVVRYLRAIVRAVLPPAPGPSPTDAGPSATEPVAVLLHVAVSPAARGTGLGRRLSEEFVRRAHTAGSRDIRLVTRTSGDAGGFYEALGWRRVGEHHRGGTVVAEYRHPAPEPSDS